MSDTATRLNAALQGRYAIEREVGEGGMATVYLADDLRHERKVALKVLKPELAAVVGAERFLAEIKTTANLQHPHILPLFDSGEADSFLFYVMPYVEGETLQGWIDREKQLPVEEAVRVTVAIANALDYAHQHGVVHRDIKPGNILLQAGEPVVGDFGIALAVGAAGGARLTETGLSVGTPFYMSPEQATGDQLVGAATDIYALGAVLYELLIGDPPYMGSTAQAVLGKIIQGSPVSVRETRRSVPANVDAAIRKALEKLPADRFTSAQEFAKALVDPAFRHGEDEAAGVGAAHAGPWRTAALVASGLTVLFAGLAIQARNRPEHPHPVERFAVPFLEGQEPTAIGNGAFSLSPDGTMLVYRHDPGTGQVLMVRRWDDLRATPIRETEGAGLPAVSPDGLEVAFQQGDEIKVLAFSGGPVRTLTTGHSPEWGPDGYVYIGTDSGAARVPATGGVVEQISRVSEGEEDHRVVEVLPGGHGVLLQIGFEGPDEMRGLDLASGEMTPIVEALGGLRGISRSRYLPSGHLVYGVPGGTVMAVRFDPDKMEMLGTPIAVIDDVFAWSLSDDGKFFRSTGGGVGGGSVTMQLLWVTRAGEATPVDPDWTFESGSDANHSWRVSPDGSMLAVRESTEAGYDIWVKRMPDGPRSRLTFGEAGDKMPVWAPGGRDITFLSDRGGNHDVWSKPADGTREAELLIDIEQDIATVEWTPDGQWLFLRTSTGRRDSSARDVLVLRPGSDSVPTRLFATEFREVSPSVSPDGRWIVYASDETGRYEIYVRPFPDVSAGRRPVSVDGGRSPRWAHSGTEIFFQGPDAEMMVVDVETGGDLVVGVPYRLFERGDRWLALNLSGTVYDVALDDQRFMVAAIVATGGDDAPPAPRFILVNNFFEELKRLVPE